MKLINRKIYTFVCLYITLATVFITVVGVNAASWSFQESGHDYSFSSTSRTLWVDKLGGKVDHDIIVGSAATCWWSSGSGDNDYYKTIIMDNQLSTSFIIRATKEQCWGTNNVKCMIFGFNGDVRRSLDDSDSTNGAAVEAKIESTFQSIALGVMTDLGGGWYIGYVESQAWDTPWFTYEYHARYETIKVFVDEYENPYY